MIDLALKSRCELFWCGLRPLIYDALISQSAWNSGDVLDTDAFKIAFMNETAAQGHH